MMASFLSFKTEMPLRRRESGTTARAGSRSVVRTKTLGRRFDLGKKGSLPKSGWSTKTDLGPVAATMGATGLVSAQPLRARSRQAIVRGASEEKRRGMVDRGGSRSVGIDQRNDFHFEAEFFLVVLRIGTAGRERVQLEILDAHVGESVFEVGHELPEVVVEGGPAQMKEGRLVREAGGRLRKHFPLHAHPESRV